MGYRLSMDCKRPRKVGKAEVIGEMGLIGYSRSLRLDQPYVLRYAKMIRNHDCLYPSSNG